MNYGAFKTQVAQYLHRTDLTSLVPTFIENGRIRLFDQLRVPEMVRRSTLSLSSGEGALSQDFVGIRTVYDASDNQPLDQVSLDAVRVYTTGVYAVQGQTLVAPGYTSLEVIWYERPLTFLGAADSATRTLLDAYPLLWLQAALVEGNIYIDDAEAEQKARARLDAEVQAANVRAFKSMFGPGHVSSGLGVNVVCGDSGL